MVLSAMIEADEVSELYRQRAVECERAQKNPGRPRGIEGSGQNLARWLADAAAAAKTIH